MIRMGSPLRDPRSAYLLVGVAALLVYLNALPNRFAYDDVLIVQSCGDELLRFGVALLFVIGVMLFTIVRADGGTHGVLLVIAAMIGGYMAMNIGANDVANNVGPAVG